MSSRTYEANIYGHDLDVSYPPKSDYREKSIQITHIYLSFQRRCQRVKINSLNVTQIANI